MALKTWSTGRKIALLGVLCALAAGGGAFAAAAPGLAQSGISSEAGSPARTTPGLAVPVVAPAELAVSPADGAKQVNPAAPVSLKVTNGRIDRVALTSDGGDTVDGTLGTNGSAWTSSGNLTFNTRYNFTYSVVDDAGRETHSTRAFTTVSTANEADAAIYPLDGMKVGVAQPLQITPSASRS
ncbi:Ig-like domain-containing protein [Arthrobacter sp. I3]|uniref:Ig-like domain-containing protein n=1 Tax=Arthrobacter sp. I3 TaxID=218158 RepID=UPI0031B87B4F